MSWQPSFASTQLSAQAALADTRIPLVEVNTDEDGEAELELDDDPAHAARLDTAHVPVLVTVSQARACALSVLFRRAAPGSRHGR